MTPKFKPLLAFTVEDTSTLKYPLFASIKLDGIRVVILDGVVYSRTLKPIRSKTVQKLFGKTELNGVDAEILYGDWNAPNVFNLTTTAVMSIAWPEELDDTKLSLAVFDNVLSEGGYEERLNKLHRAGFSFDYGPIWLLDQTQIESEEHLLDFEAASLRQGYEGVMVRSIDGRYKQGRSTLKEGIIGKLKRFTDDEALVVGFEEKMTNTNEAKINELGRSQRSQAIAGMVGANTLGAFICEYKGMTLQIGSGLNDATRIEIWNNKEKYLGKYVKFKHFQIGVKDAPRFPIFLGFRDVEDM